MNTTEIYTAALVIAVLALAVWLVSGLKPELRAKVIGGAALTALLAFILRSRVRNNPSKSPRMNGERLDTQTPTIPYDNPKTRVQAQISHDEEHVQRLDRDELRDSLDEYDQRANTKYPEGL